MRVRKCICDQDSLSNAFVIQIHRLHCRIFLINIRDTVDISTELGSFYLILSCHSISYLRLSYLRLAYLIPSHLILSHLISSHLISSHLISPYLISSYLISYYLILSHLILSYLILSHLMPHHIRYLNQIISHNHHGNFLPRFTDFLREATVLFSCLVFP